MKQDNDKTIFTYYTTYRAYLDCRVRKRKTVNALKFEYELENNLYQLLQELKNRTYRPGRSTCFVVTKPSVREIFAADFRDRVIHHIFVNEIIGMAEQKFCSDSYACRTGKGTHAAVRRLGKLIPKVTNNYRQEAYYLQLDIASFFMSIDQRILFGIVEKYITDAKRSALWKDEMLWLARVIIFNKTADNFVKKGRAETFDLLPKRKSLIYAAEYKGLPIGNLTSQFFANVYLNEVDQYVKRELKCRYYVRYVDDMILLSSSRAKLVALSTKIDTFMSNKLGLGLNLQKTKLKAIGEGIDFLGYFVKPDYILIRKKVVRRFWAKLWQREETFKIEIAKSGTSVEAKAKATHKNRKKIKAMAASYYGHMKHANAKTLKKNLKHESRLSWSNMNRAVIC